MIRFVKSMLKSIPPIQGLVKERNSLRERTAALEQQIKRHDARHSPCYDHDGMRLVGKNTDFLNDERFLKSYQLGMNSGHKIGRRAGSEADIHIEWRVHIACWAACHALHLPGDLVECGVNTGILSLAICNYIDFNSTGKSFYLFDTYCGIPEEQMLERERPFAITKNRNIYEDCYETATRNFQQFPRARLVRGKVPDTLSTPSIDRVCYLSIDMNIAQPEVAALRFFWDRLTTGAVVLLDDYGFSNHVEQKKAMDGFAREKGVAVATLPTGQGLLLKP